MTTAFSSPQLTQVGPLLQLVLFPEIVGADALPLDVYDAPTQQQEERPFSVQDALDAGQLALFPLV